MLYVAYGSNIPSKQMLRRCKNAKFIGKGILKDYELNFNFHADINHKKGSIVDVVVWDINNEDEIILDYYEGYPNYYTKHTVEVVLNNNKIITGMIYEMQKEYKQKKSPSKDYFNIILNGYNEFGLNVKNLYKTLNKVGVSNIREYQYCI